MTIDEIIASLGIDLTNPEAKRGALDAIDAIITSRQPIPPSMGSMATSSQEPEEVEIDPDLILPSAKNTTQSTANDADIEIEDEDDVLSQIKRNDSDEASSQQSSSNQNGSDGHGGDNSDNEQQGDRGSGSSDDNDTAQSQQKPDTDSADAVDSGIDDLQYDDEAQSAGGEQEDSTKAKSDDADETEEANNQAAQTDDVLDADEDALPADGDGYGDDEESTSLDGEDSVDGGGLGDGGESMDDEDTIEDENDGEADFDEDDFLDTDISQALIDTDISAKERARKIKRARTVQAAEAALEQAKKNKVAQPLIHELEQAIQALKSIQEAKAKKLQDMSDEEFNMAINRVLDAMDACGTHDLSYTSDEERQLAAKEIQADLSDPNTARELSAEDAELIRQAHQEVQAREKEANKYQARPRDSFKGFQDFLLSLTRAMALQVKIDDEQEDSWSAINRRYSGTGVLKQGRRINELPNNTIPIIDFYFDCSASWGASDIAIGKKAAAALGELEEQGKIKVNMYYFSNDVFSDFASAEAQGGTRAWNEIVKNVISTQATNVVIMTDDDMEDWWYPQDKPPLRYTVPGYVWYLWKGGSNAPRLPRDLKGRSGTQQFSFNRGDL